MVTASARAKKWVRKRGESIVYRVAGLPVAFGAWFAGPPDGTAAKLRAIYAHDYWRPDDLTAFGDLVAAVVLWPAVLLAAAAWFGWKNGSIVRQRCGKLRTRQFVEQLHAYFSAGVLPPWYYVFELHREGSDCHSFINRFETKQGYYSLLRSRRRPTSELNDKVGFAARCRAHQLRTVPVVATAIDGRVAVLESEHLPLSDLFVKPISAAGGTGAERWDYVDGRYLNEDGQSLDERQLLDRLCRQSRFRSQLVQTKVANCAELRDLNNCALTTVRVLTCLDEEDRPEIIAAVLRMAVGNNHRVDNIHAGGIAAPIDLVTGKLGPASDLGMDAGLGWLDRHPDCGGWIRGRTVPRWSELCDLAKRAHKCFDDRIAVGWDIAPTEDGPIIVEGNSGPDVDLMQRPARAGMANGRFGELLLYHLSH